MVRSFESYHFDQVLYTKRTLIQHGNWVSWFGQLAIEKHN